MEPTFRGPSAVWSKVGLGVLTLPVWLNRPLSLCEPWCPHLSQGKKPPPPFHSPARWALCVTDTARGQAPRSPSGGHLHSQASPGHPHVVLQTPHPFLLRHHSCAPGLSASESTATHHSRQPIWCWWKYSIRALPRPTESGPWKQALKSALQKPRPGVCVLRPLQP